MKNFFTSLVSFSLVMFLSMSFTSQVHAERNDDLSFEQISSLRTDTSRHRNSAPLPPLSIQVSRDMPALNMLEVVLPPDMPALISHEMTNAKILGNAVDEGRLSTLINWDNLSPDQKILQIAVNGGLKKGDMILIEGLSLKVHEYNQRTFRPSLRYSPDGTASKRSLLSGLGVFLQVRSDNVATPGQVESSLKSRNHVPEPPRQLRISKNTDDSVQINWTKNADHDLSGYTLQVINDLTNITVFEERVSSEKTMVNIGTLDPEKTYRLFFAVVDTSGLKSTDEIAFSTTTLPITPEADLPPAPEPIVAEEPEPAEEPESLEFQKTPKFTSDDTGLEPKKQEKVFKLPENIQDITHSEELIQDALQKVQPDLPSSGFSGNAPVRPENLLTLIDSKGFEGIFEGTKKRRLMTQIKRLERKFVKENMSDLSNADVVKIFAYIARYKRIKNARLVQRIVSSPSASRDEIRHRRYVYSLQKKALITPELSEQVFYGLGKIRTEDFYLMMYYTLKRLEDTSGRN